ncbi:hypothetical protein E4U42_001116, partial [Claviceps africana]
MSRRALPSEIPAVRDATIHGNGRKRASPSMDDDGPRAVTRVRTLDGDGDDDDDDEDEDDDDDDYDDGKPPEERLICDFCKNHPQGRVMHEIRPCNWTSIGGKYVLECQNCADHRFGDNPGHVCCIGRRKQARQIYATQHPLEYPRDFVCENCKTNNYGNTCDADPILGLSCTSCVTAKPLPADKAKH